MKRPRESDRSVPIIKDEGGISEFIGGILETARKAYLCIFAKRYWAIRKKIQNTNTRVSCDFVFNFYLDQRKKGVKLLKLFPFCQRELMAQMHTRLGNLMKQSGRYSLHTEEVIRRKHNNWTYSTFRKYVPKSWETIHQIVYLRMPRGGRKLFLPLRKEGFLEL